MWLRNATIQAVVTESHMNIGGRVTVIVEQVQMWKVHAVYLIQNLIVKWSCSMKPNRFRFRVWGKRTKELELLDVACLCSYLDQDEDYIIMQSTGLTDKNGKEIFEGDLIEVGYRMDYLITVEWEQETASFSESVWQYPDGVEVVGNIYENPELLTK
jgi:hypothetical protein